MKKSIWSAVFIFTVLFSCSITAQQQRVINYEQQAKMLFNMIPTSLENEIPGIVESTIYNAIVAKRYYPSADFTGIIDKLNGIAAENPDPSMRVKAFLAAVYLSSSDIICVKPDPVAWEHDGNYIYKQIAEQLENKVLAQK
jgi:hypothetical protein